MMRNELERRRLESDHKIDKQLSRRQRERLRMRETDWKMRLLLLDERPRTPKPWPRKSSDLIQKDKTANARFGDELRDYNNKNTGRQGKHRSDVAHRIGLKAKS